MRLNQVMRRVTSWLEEHGLVLATEKSEIVLLTAKRYPTIGANAGGHTDDRDKEGY